MVKEIPLSSDNEFIIVVACWSEPTNAETQWKSVFLCSVHSAHWASKLLFLSSKFDKVPVDREFLTGCLQSSLSRSSWVLNGWPNEMNPLVTRCHSWSSQTSFKRSSQLENCHCTRRNHHMLCWQVLGLGQKWNRVDVENAPFSLKTFILEAWTRPKITLIAQLNYNGFMKEREPCGRKQKAKR